jgi:7-carboxy-7-deazaguanine synthase
MQTATHLQTLPVMEHFYTLQGEGMHMGKAAYFIRLAGCDVGCHWCDVKESWDATQHPHISIQQLVSSVIAASHSEKTKPIVVITGGEPLLHSLDALTSTLQAAGFDTHIETSGSSPLSGNWNWICLSPKKFKQPLPAIVPLANELKVVVFNQSDFNWAQQFAEQTNPNCKLYLQPEWDKKDIVLPLIIDYIKDHPQWQLSLQAHKYIQVP